MRILIVNTFYYPNMKGGAEQSVKLLSENLVKRGHEVGVFCIDGKDTFISEEQYQGVKVFRHTSGNFDLYKFSYDKKKINKFEKVRQKLICYYNRKTIRDFYNILCKFKPDVVHTNSTYGISLFVWKVAYKLNIPVVHTIRDTAIVSPVTYGHHVNSLILNVYKAYVKYFSKYVSAVTAPSEYTLNTSLNNSNFRNAIVKKCVVNSVQIDMTHFKQELEEKKKRTSDCIKFMYAGRLVAYKGIEHMIQAFEKLKNDKLELHICGGGAMADYVSMHANVDSRIIYHGSLDNMQLAKVYEACDVLLVPSCWPEPFGRVVIEGNLHAMPVIAGNWGGIPEIVKSMKGGVLYDAPSTEELEKLINHFKSREYIVSFLPEIEKNMSVYSIENQINEFEKIYNSILLNKVVKC